jgi:hypothetical protein
MIDRFAREPINHPSFLVPKLLFGNGLFLKLRFALQGRRGRNGVSKASVPKQEFGNEEARRKG